MHLGDLTMRSCLLPARAPSHGWACKSLHSHVLSHLLHQKLQCKEGMKMEIVKDSPLQPVSPGLAMNWVYPLLLDKESKNTICLTKLYISKIKSYQIELKSLILTSSKSHMMPELTIYAQRILSSLTHETVQHKRKWQQRKTALLEKNLHNCTFVHNETNLNSSTLH